MKHLWIALLLVAGIAKAQEQLPAGFDPQRHMRVAEVKEGMKGYGLSVFKGTRIERFEVEVLSVLRNFNPKHDVVLVRLKGANLELTGPIAGMSGSPVFLKDEQGRERMVGAFAYGWPLMKEPVGGVQPIEYMLKLSGKARHGEVGNREVGKWTYASLGDKSDVKKMLGSGDEPMRLRPLMVPMMVSGLPQKVMREFEPMMRARGLAMLQAGGAATSQPTGRLEPGACLAVPMLTGDVEMAAVGTCTEVLGDRVLGFGHPFMSEGDVSLPMSGGYVHGVIANLSTSFKLGAAGRPVGTLVTDELAGIAGQLGDSPAGVPIELRCVYADGSLDQTFRFRAAQHPRFLPILAAMAVSAATSSSREPPQYHTVDYDLTMEFANGQTLHMQNRAGEASMMEVVRMVALPVQAAAENPFERVKLTKMTGTVRVIGESKQSEILSVHMPRSKYRPGETVKAVVRHRPFRLAEATLPVEFELPRDLPDGDYEFIVSDSREHLSQEQQSRPFRFTANSAKEVFDVLRDAASVKQNAVYLRLVRQPDGVAIGRTAMPKLPGSRRQVMLGAGLSNTTGFVSSEVKTVSTEYVMSGSARFSVTIDKDVQVETREKE